MFSVRLVGSRILPRVSRIEGFRLDNDVLAICPNAAATPDFAIRVFEYQER